MSISSGLQIIRIPIKPILQTTSLWTGSSPTSPPIAILDKGNYNITYACALQPSVGTLTNCFGIISKNAVFGQPGYVELCASAKTGGLGTLSGTTPNGFCIQNNVYIDTDNTPIYLYLAVTIGGGSIWGIPLATQYDTHMNYITFIKA